MQRTDDLPEFDRNKDEYYTERLISLSDDQPVIASEDVYNQFGVLLIARGSPVSQRVAERLRNHRLEKPLDRQIDLQQGLSTAAILADICELLEQPVFRSVHETCEFQPVLRHLCMSRSMAPLLRQKLSVMKHQLPEEYTHSLLCGWLCGLLAKEMKLSPGEADDAFVAGLAHDIGLLHLPPELQSRDSNMSEEQWRAFQSHVVIGKLIMDELDCYGSAVGQALLEHHERLDQTGFPTRKAAPALGLIGQLVGCCDFILKLAHNELAGQGRPLHACLSHLKVSHRAFRDDIYAAIFRIMSRGRGTEPVQSAHQLSGRVFAVNEQLQRLCDLLQEFSGIPADSAAARVADRILSVRLTSGLERESLLQWLNPEEPGDDAEMGALLLETDSIQYELLWLFKRLGWSLDQLASDANGCDQFRAWSAALEKQLSAAWPLYL